METRSYEQRVWFPSLGVSGQCAVCSSRRRQTSAKVNISQPSACAGALGLAEAVLTAEAGSGGLTLRRGSQDTAV